jgi:hypothetical protein
LIAINGFPALRAAVGGEFREGADDVSHSSAYRYSRDVPCNISKKERDFFVDYISEKIPT